MSEAPPKSEEPLLIMKYANRRLYDKRTSEYIVFGHLVAYIRDEVHFIVIDNETRADITREVLFAALEEVESQRPAPRLSIKTLRRLLKK